MGLRDYNPYAGVTAHPWWWVIGRDASGKLQHLRVNEATTGQAQVAFERSFPGARVLSVAREEYRNELVA